MSDLGDILARAGTELGGQTGPMDDRALRRVVAGARRRRVRRHTFQGVAAVAAVAVLGAGGWWGAQREQPVPAHTPTPRVSTPAPATPTPTPTPTSSVDDPVRPTWTVDPAVVEQIRNPSTGETWQDPQPATDQSTLVRDDMREVAEVLRVGARGDAAIYALLAADGVEGTKDVLGLVEVDSTGSRLVACPSPMPEDPCSDERPYAVAPHVEVDTRTRYASLVVPTTVVSDTGLSIRTTASLTALRRETLASGQAPLGELPTAESWFGAFDVVELATAGRGGLVELRGAPRVPGLLDLQYAWRTPLGTYVVLDRPADLPGAVYDDITWDDGVDRHVGEPVADDPERWTAGSLAPGGPGVCSDARFSIDTAFEPSQWRPAGRTPDGQRVYVPVQEGNERARQVRAHQEATSWAVDDDFGMLEGPPAYAVTGFGTDEAFLAAHVLYALHSPTGGWLLGLSHAAAGPAYECV